MHAERLNSLAREILATYTEHDPVRYLNELVGVVNNRISNPSDPALDKVVSAAHARLREALNQLAIERFPPIARKMMEDLGLGILIPETVRKRIDQAFEARFVDSDVVGSLEALLNEMKKTISSLTALRDGFQAMGIAEDQLAPEEVEFNAAMPREAIDDHLGGFARLLGHLNTELTVLASIAKDDREPLKINSISTNDFTVALNINVDLGDIVQTILLGLIMLRVSNRNQIEALKAPAFKGMPQDIIDRAVAWVRGEEDRGIHRIVDDLPSSAPTSVDPAKLVAHREAVVEAVKFLHDKQEVGFNMEVRTGEPEEEVTAEAEVDEARRLAINSRRVKIREISAKAATMKVLTAQNTPILTLGVDKDAEGAAPKAEGDE